MVRDVKHEVLPGTLNLLVELASLFCRRNKP
jgi:hypothetical protein